ncbi:MAG: SMP-30/gluconolactonase/LRE family protein [Planctomycetota bacterium]
MNPTEILDTPDDAALKFLPEGPYPLADGKFSWVAIQHGADSQVGSLNVFDLATGQNQSFPLPGRPGFAFPCTTEGRFVVGCERSLGYFDTRDNSWAPFCTGVDDDVDNTIINDGLVYKDNLIFGTKDLEFASKKAGLYLYRGRDERLIRLRDDQICSNGKAVLLSADGSLSLLDIDSPTRKIVSYALDVDAGTLGDPSTVVDFAGDPAVPDGMLVTPDGRALIVSMFRPEAADHGETRMHDLATGNLLAVWETAGSPQNTCPAIIRADGGLKLVITTAVENMDTEAQAACPGAGRLFVADLDWEDSGSELAPRFPK